MVWTAITAAITAVIAATAIVQWRESRRSAERQLRAYIFIDTATCRIDEEKIGVKLKFRNFGATPAANVTVRFAFAPESELPAVMAIKPTPKNSFAPTGTMTISHAKPFDDFLPVAIRGVACVMGRVDYMDSFGQPRWTSFKMRYIESTVTSDAGLQPTDDGNDFN